MSSFLLFRLPNTKQFYLINNQNIGRFSTSLFPFDQGNVLNIFSDEIKEIQREEVETILTKIQFLKQKKKINIPNEEQYLEKITKAIDEVKNNHWQKLVISRPLSFSTEKIDLGQTFLNLSEKFPNTFCYVWKDDERTWVGASPEILGIYHKKKSLFETMSLAGTLLLKNEWTFKEKEEQKAVTQYISNILKQYSLKVKQSEVYEHILGKIKHLRTDFSAEIKYENLDFIVKDLHPTPAVCSFPKDICKRKILEIEDYDREYYTGFLKIEMEDKIYFFVNLRCVQIFEDNAIVYVGGGVTGKSIPKNEWKETEWKSQMILENICK